MTRASSRPSERQPLVLALDIATRCGFARGKVGELPIAGSVRFGQSNASNNSIFGHCLAWLSKELEPARGPI
jgi:hypothetical protein